MEYTAAPLYVDGNDPEGRENMTWMSECEASMNDVFEYIRWREILCSLEAAVGTDAGR